MHWKYWSAFVACQAGGIVLPRFANVHTNLTPLFAGIILLLPGSLVMLPGSVSAHLLGKFPDVVVDAIVILINLAVWFGARKLLDRQLRSS